MNLGDIESVRGGLTLPLLAGDEPFGLSEAEYFTPDDWAWLFLSMNRDYAKAFEAQAAIGAAGNDALQAFCEDALNASVIPDRDGSCRSRFGLAAWINPSLERLPRLRQEGSWFFPLMSPVPENHLRTEVSDVPFAPPARPPNPANPYLQAVEVPLGYLPTRTVPQSSIHSSVVDSWGVTRIAVDCSVPPEGHARRRSRHLAPDASDPVPAQICRVRDGERPWRPVVEGAFRHPESVFAGALRYLLRGGLLTPSEITAATADQRQEVDPLEAFINDKLKKSAGEEIPLKELFELYLSWKKENPTYQNMTKPEIGRRLEEKGYIKNVRGNLPYFQGLTVESLD